MSSLKNIDLGTPVYRLKVPSTGQEVTYRPFLVKEEKLLMTALESKDEVSMIDALKKVTKSCIETKDFDVDVLATFDLEYIFLQLRSKSIGETVKVGLKCKKDDVINEVEIDLSKIVVKKTKGHTSLIKLTDSVGMEMKYPTFDSIKGVSSTDTDSIFGTVIKSIKTIYNGDDVMDVDTLPEKDVKEFIDRLSNEQFKKVQKFFDTMPKLSCTVKYECKDCGTKNEQVLEGLASFF